MQVNIDDTCDDPSSCTIVTRTAQQVIQHLAPDARFSVNFLLCDDARIQQINRDFRHKDTPTDVLSFAYFDADAIPTLAEEVEIGDIAISLPRVRENSVTHGVSYQQELEFMVIHGILHVFGYDHETSLEDEQRMRELETQLLKLVESNQTTPTVQ